MSRQFLTSEKRLIGCIVCAVVGFALGPLVLQLFVVDLLILANIILSASLLIRSLCLSRELAFLTAPNNLRINLVFNLMVDCIVTCLVLTYGAQSPYAAGSIIITFGNFVVGGNFIVGFLVFLIVSIGLSVVSFTLLFQSAKRVSIATSRLACDAKSAGCEPSSSETTWSLARAKREEMARESRFYGDMDGVLKLGEVATTAAIIIIPIILIGGMFIGMRLFGHDAGWCLKRFGILMIGASLVSLIPTLAVSIATGIIVAHFGSGDTAIHGAAVVQVRRAGASGTVEASAPQPFNPDFLQSQIEVVMSAPVLWRVVEKEMLGRVFDLAYHWNSPSDRKADERAFAFLHEKIDCCIVPATDLIRISVKLNSSLSLAQRIADSIAVTYRDYAIREGLSSVLVVEEKPSGPTPLQAAPDTDSTSRFQPQKGPVDAMNPATP